MSRNTTEQSSNESRNANVPSHTSHRAPSIQGSDVSASSRTALVAQHASNTTGNDTTRGSRILAVAKWIQWFLLDQWFLVALGILITISSQVQVPESGQEIKRKIATYLAVAIIFFITGCTLPTRKLLENYSRWQLHLFVQLQCFAMTSVTAFGVVSAAATNRDFMDPWLLIGLIFLGCVPTTISSNVVMTKQAHGNEALTVTFATIGNVLGAALAPVLVTAYTSTGAWYTKVLPSDSGSYGDIFLRVLSRIGGALLAPLVAGQLVQAVFPKATEKVFVQWKCSKISTVALLVVLWQTYDQAFHSGAFTSVKGDNLVFTVFVSIGFIVLWLSVAFFTSIMWLPKADTISVSYCVPAKTPVMGVPLSTVLYLGLSPLNESKIQIPMVIFQGFQVASGSLLTMVFRRWVARDAVGADRDCNDPGEESTHQVER